MNMKYEEPKIPQLVPKPLYCKGIKNPVISLDGIWKVKHTTELSHHIEDETFSTWEDITVPSDMTVHRHERELYVGAYIYKKLVTLPKEIMNQECVLRFEGINGFAKVYIDGKFVMEHENGFISWNKNITEFIKDKNQFVLTISVDEKADHVSTYSHGGIIHPVMLYILPTNYFNMIHTTTTFDDNFTDSKLRIDYAVYDTLKDYQYEAELISPEGLVVTEINIPGNEFKEDGTNSVELNVLKPAKWDAEHPWLYTLRLTILKDQEKIEQIEHRFGFRQIDRVVNQLFINGQEVKLRGICRHEVSPLNGRALTKELIEEDVALFKEANCNYIRTSHYPPSEYFLQLCDEKGIYVEDELALAFIARTLDYTQRDPAQTQRYLSHFSEVLARDYSHPSVIIWSLCNESFGGYNFDLLNRFAHKMDPTRPTKFSYPMTMQEEHEPIDIWSVHYANLDGDLAKKNDNVSVGYSPGYDMPVIHDEYAHIPCYNRTEHRRDPNVRSFWGESIKKFWDKIWNTKGALGGAIWAGIDETDIFRGGKTSLEWGIIDIWRRKKPEHYMTRKAYSPIVLPNEKVVLSEDHIASLEIENRFCHTNLNEVLVEWKYGELSGAFYGGQIKPRETGIINFKLPVDFNLEGYEVELTFIDAFGNRVDEYLLPVVSGGEDLVLYTEGAIVENTLLSYLETEESFVITAKEFHLEFAKETGLLTQAISKGESVLIGGPYLNVPYIKLGKWRNIDFKVKKDKGEIVVTTKGTYENKIDVTFNIIIQLDGSITTQYTIDKMYVKLPKKVKLRVGVDCGGLDELGVYYVADPQLDTLTWKRKGLWTVYPEDHIARCQGVAKRRSAGSTFAEEPSISWAEEMKSYILNGRYDVDYKGTNDFRSLKENIYYAKLSKDESEVSIRALSDGSHSVRLEVAEPMKEIISDRDPRIHYSGTWYPMEDYSGSLYDTEMWSKEVGAYAECTFTGRGIVWYGPVDTIYGIAKVYIDGEVVDKAINQRVNGVDFPGSAAGYDKKYGYPLYSITGLENREHTIRIEVTGTKAEDAGDCYIVMDYLRVITEPDKEPIRFIINNEHNYPHIAWGNYTKPAILIKDGYSNFVKMQLT